MITNCNLCHWQNKPACPFPGDNRKCGEYKYDPDKLREATKQP